jgi:hypothetical protein
VTNDEFPNRRINAEPSLVASAFRAAKEELEEADPASSAPYLQSAATLAYALGLPLSEVRDYGRRALLAYREVLRQRPPLEAFQKPVSPGTWLEYSVGSSRVGLSYLYWALLLRESELAREIAENTWDPPTMGRVRILPEYRVAYGLRDLILGKGSETLSQLKQLPASAKVYLHKQASAISALAREACSEVAPAIVELSEATRAAMSREYLPQKKLFALAGAGLSSYALDHGLMTREDLPRAIEIFPLELVLSRG